MSADKYAQFEKPWRWSCYPRPLARCGEAPEELGFYEIGYYTGGTFKPKYGGRAAGVTLRTRLSKHFRSSHNPGIRKAAATGKLWYRYKVFGSAAAAKFVEALFVIAYDEEYEWNDRQEWAQHWALER